MTKKLAVFVEGQTEQIFMQRLLREIVGQKNIAIDSLKFIGSGPARLRRVTGNTPANVPFYAQICDCHGGGEMTTVVSDIRDHYQGLVQEGFSLVLGLRDVYPVPMSRMEKLREGITSVLPHGKVPVRMIFAVREMEAWFIVEDRHYLQIHPGLTPRKINKELHINVSTIHAESIHHPAELLNKIYRLKTKGYQKSRFGVQRTIDALNFDYLVHEVPKRAATLGELCQSLQDFFEITPKTNHPA
ncbi:MAG: DUF4276 family protein [Sumerlaeia bacterium]